MLDVLRNEPLFRKCEAFQQAIKAQFAVRMNCKSKDAIDAAHNQFNSEPRFCYKFNTSQRNLYPNEEFEEDLSENVKKREIVQAKSGAKNQFQLLYPVQVYPDFLAHLVDCMLSPMDIVKNWKGSNVFFSAPGP